MEKNIYMLLNQVETDFEEYKILEWEQGEPEESTARILDKLHGEDFQRILPRSRKRRAKTKKMTLKRLLGTAAVLIVCILSIGGAVYAATDGAVFDYMYTFITGGIAYEKTESSIMGESSVSTVVMASDAVSTGEGAGFPLLFEDGRLYFTGDGGKTDITDNISETEPYYINVIDETGILHRFNIGGRPEEGYYGYNEMIFDEEGVFRAGTGFLGEQIGEQGMPEWYRKGIEEATGLEIPPSSAN